MGKLRKQPLTKAIVLKQFRCIETKKVYDVNTEIELTKERFAHLEKLSFVKRLS